MCIAWILLFEDVPFIHRPQLHSQISRRDLVHNSGECWFVNIQRASQERLLHRSHHAYVVYTRPKGLLTARAVAVSDCARRAIISAHALGSAHAITVSAHAITVSVRYSKRASDYFL